MSQGRHGIKILGLSLLTALGLMAFAASAQAVGEFLIEGTPGTVKTFTVHGLAQETVEGTIAAGKLLVPGFALTISCAGGVFTGTVLLGGIAHANALFSGCEGSAACKPYETKGKMETNLAADRGFFSASGLGELILMGSKHYLLVSSSAFTTIYWPKLCALTLEWVIAGSVVFSLPSALTPLVNQPINTIPQTELESLFPTNVLRYINQRLWLDEGAATAALSGPSVAKKWGAH